MFAEERQSKILDVVNENGRISVKELCDKLNASEATIRRDLKILEDEERIKRTHGGAVSLEHINLKVEPTFIEKESKFQEQKRKIGLRAFELLEDNETLVLDSGTTVLELAKCISNSNISLTVVTNSIIAAKVLAKNERINIYLAGGTLRPNTLSSVGTLTNDILNRFNVNKAFVGTNGVTLKRGLTTPDLSEAHTKNTMIKIATETIVLTDSSKFGQVALCQISPIEVVDQIITDDAVNKQTIKEFLEEKINVVTV